MKKNKGKNYLEISEEAQKSFIIWMTENTNYEDTPSYIEIVNWWLKFFKRYFQEKMHEISLRELEEEHPLYKKEYNELPEIVDNSKLNK